MPAKDPPAKKSPSRSKKAAKAAGSKAAAGARSRTTDGTKKTPTRVDAAQKATDGKNAGGEGGSGQEVALVAVDDDPDLFPIGAEPAGASGAAIVEQDSEDEAINRLGFPVVGIGASAGGFEAVSDLLETLPKDVSLAIVLVQHLDPTHESQLVPLLSRKTAFKVVEIDDGMAIKPGHVYVIPPRSFVTMQDGTLRLGPRGEVRGHQNVIDRFFRSLAEDQGDHAVGVILSGTLSDGTAGMHEIKAAGGFTFAQDMESAKYREMPRNAIQSGNVDFVMSPSEIAKELAELPTADRLAPTQQASIETLVTGDEAVLEHIFAILKKHLGVDFSNYKRTTLLRRIHRRMMTNKRDSLTDYLDYIKTNPRELDLLFNEILITVTRFFRDEEPYEILANDVIPKLLEKRPENQPLRMWSPGCATGEEAYSLAITVKEVLHERGLNIPVQVFGTDISPHSLKVAREGLYPETIMEDVSQERLNRWFDKVDGGYRVNKSIRGLCVFAVQDLAKDPPFSNMDLISCRNVLIYMQARLQRRVLAVLHYALKLTGFLMLGSSEAIGRYEELFSEYDRKAKLYTKTGASPPLADLNRTPELGVAPELAAGLHAPRWDNFDVQREADRVLLEMYGPPGVVVNENMDVLEFRGDTSPYFSHAPGPASLNLMKISRQGLGVELRACIQDVKRQAGSVTRENVRYDTAAGARGVTLQAVPLEGPASKDQFFLILFHDPMQEMHLPQPPAPRKQGRPASLDSEGNEIPGLAEDQDMRIQQLERQLDATRDYLQSIIEDYEATNEELRSANEEALSTNEELQSTNEELETAKEGLQSTNEELTTLNDELQQRNLEIQKMNNDLINLLDSVSIPIVMLGPDLRIRRFTSLAEGVLNLIPTDIGRPFSDINHKLKVDKLDERVRGVFDSFQVQELDASKDGVHYRLQLHPYRTADKRIDGVVIVLIERDAPA